MDRFGNETASQMGYGYPTQPAPSAGPSLAQPAGPTLVDALGRLGKTIEHMDQMIVLAAGIRDRLISGPSAAAKPQQEPPFGNINQAAFVVSAKLEGQASVLDDLLRQINAAIG